MAAIEKALVTFALVLGPAVAHAQMHHMHGAPPMEGLLGRYPVTRAASGTAWQPDAARQHADHGDTPVSGLLFLHAEIR